MLKSFDYDWFARIVQLCPANVCLVLTHDIEGVPARLTSLATDFVKLEDSLTLRKDLMDITRE
eukprot:652845-Rhodomonas_salina.9